jgi:hypothetical protein
MAYIGGDLVLLFGGYDGSSADDETWVYDLSANTWTQQYPSPKPSARRYHDMAYIGGDQALLFGGDSGSQETWVYDLSANAWTQQNPASPPSPRDHHAMAYIGGDQVLLFGGDDPLGYDDQSWVYDLSANTWTIHVVFPSPSARVYHDMAYIGGDQVLLFGGWDGAWDDETWVFDLGDNEWFQDLNSAQPSARYDHGLAGTSMDGSGYVVLFGGYDVGAHDDETWLFGGGDFLVLTDPGIVSVEDVPNDQGREVAVLWERSYLDAPAFQVITNYSIWRQYPYGADIESICDEWKGTALDNLDQMVYRMLPREPGGDQADYWEFMGTVDAHFFEEYAYIAPTLADSSGSGIPYFTFLVSAHTADPFVFYDSDPDSGYSVDNTTPATTTVAIRFEGGCAPGTIRLMWDEVTTGVDGTAELIPVDYRVYCSTDAYFARPPASLVTTTGGLSCDHTDPLIGDPAYNLYYFVTAVDGSDNESAASNTVGEFDWGVSAGP